MRQPRIAAALTVGAIVLIIAYGGAWVMLPGTIDASEGGTRASYEVVTEGGAREVLEERAPAHARADLVQLPKCPSCLHEYPRAQLATQIEGLVATLIAAPPPPPRGAPPRFSAGLFALLVVVFPPLAILHALRAAG